MPITATPLHQPALTQEMHNFGLALRELVSAARQLARALWSSMWYRPGNPARPLTAVEEANQVRAMADDCYASDPRFAQDLHAAATRHELAGGTC